MEANKPPKPQRCLWNKFGEELGTGYPELDPKSPSWLEAAHAQTGALRLFFPISMFKRVFDALWGRSTG
jgi:hypothetical protein